MKFNVISDLHTEFWKGQNLMPDEYENVVLAGDINVFQRKPDGGYRILDEFGFKKQAKICIAGNHEYYGTDLAECYQYPFTKVVDGVMFICATLWTNPDPDDEMLVQTYMQDFQIISYHGRRFRVSDMQVIHKKELAFIKAKLHEPFDGKKVVVTHHLPHYMFIDEQYRMSAINGGFATDVLEEIPLEDWPAVWVFGHTHTPIDRVVHGTRFVCNPYGYFKFETSRYPTPLEIEL